MAVWAIWLLIGVLCIGLELAIPGFVIIFFGMGALITAVFSVIKIVEAFFWIQVVIFLFFSLLSLFLFKKRLSMLFGKKTENDRSENMCADFAETIEPVLKNKAGRIKYKGTTWNAVSVRDEIPAGKIVKIIRKEGLLFIVDPI